MTAMLAPWRARADLAALVAPVVVGVSGGADSTALLALAADAGLEPVAVHVDHGLRAGSANDVEVVAAIAGRLGTAFDSVRVHVAPGSDLEARARDVRHAALRDAVERHGATGVLIGHTMDDLAETVLLNTLRGAAASGLAGIATPRPGVAYPLLELRRADTIEICRRLGVAPLVDPMNAMQQFRRVWVRRELMPMLRAGAERDVVPVLARQAAVLRDESQYLDGVARDAWPGQDGATAASLVALPTPIARRAVRQWLGFPPPRGSDVDDVLALAHGTRGAVELPGGRRVSRSGGVLTVMAEPPPIVLEQEWAVPGQCSTARGQLVARVERGAPVGWPDGRASCVLDAEVAGSRLRVRAARAGERITVHGGGTKRVADVLAEAGVPPARRASVPVVAHAESDDALWIAGVRAGGLAAVRASTRQYLWLSSNVRP